MHTSSRYIVYLKLTCVNYTSAKKRRKKTFIHQQSERRSPRCLRNISKFCLSNPSVRAPRTSCFLWDRSQSQRLMSAVSHAPFHTGLLKETVRGFQGFSFAPLVSVSIFLCCPDGQSSWCLQAGFLVSLLTDTFGYMSCHQLSSLGARSHRRENQFKTVCLAVCSLGW